MWEVHSLRHVFSYYSYVYVYLASTIMQIASQINVFRQVVEFYKDINCQESNGFKLARITSAFDSRSMNDCRLLW